MRPERMDGPLRRARLPVRGPGVRVRSRPRRAVLPASASHVLAALALLIAAPSWAQETTTLTGVVLDSESGEGVAAVFVGVDDSDEGALTDAEGRFRIEDLPPGEHMLVFDHVAYGRNTHAVRVEADTPLAFEVRISREAIRLDPLVVEVLSQTERRHLTTGFSTSQIEVEEIQLAARQGLRLIDLLRHQMPGIRFRRLPPPPAGSGGNRSLSGAGRECIEYRQQGYGSTCRNMTVILDGAPLGNPFDFMPMMDLDEIQRLEVLSPGEAGARYGSLAGNGVLLVETRSGTLAQRSSPLPATMTFHEWSRETEAHGWWRVFRTALITNVVTVGVSSLGLAYCTEVWDGSLQVRSRCPEAVGLGTGVVAMALPGVAVGFAAHRSGTTNLSRGRVDWAMSLGSFSTWAGYLVLFNGRARESAALQGAGVALLALGTPLAVTLSDRLFRSFR